MIGGYHLWECHLCVCVCVWDTIHAGYQGDVKCRVPRYSKSPLPALTQVYVSMNGVDFTSSSATVFFYDIASIQPVQVGWLQGWG